MIKQDPSNGSDGGGGDLAPTSKERPGACSSTNAQSRQTLPYLCERMSCVPDADADVQWAKKSAPNFEPGGAPVAAAAALMRLSRSVARPSPVRVADLYENKLVVVRVGGLLQGTGDFEINAVDDARLHAGPPAQARSAKASKRTTMSPDLFWAVMKVIKDTEALIMAEARKNNAQSRYWLHRRIMLDHLRMIRHFEITPRHDPISGLPYPTLATVTAARATALHNAPYLLPGGYIGGFLNMRLTRRIHIMAPGY